MKHAYFGIITNKTMPSYIKTKFFSFIGLLIIHNVHIPPYISLFPSPLTHGHILADSWKEEAPSEEEEAIMAMGTFRATWWWRSTGDNPYRRLRSCPSFFFRTCVLQGLFPCLLPCQLLPPSPTQCQGLQNQAWSESLITAPSYSNSVLMVYPPHIIYLLLFIIIFIYTYLLQE